VVDSIVARDIGKLPDVTVGDALQRITGVQVTRNNDQVIGVNVRGLPNVVTTLNGDEIFTTTLRTFDFQNLPAEVLSGLSVYKTSSADQIEGGIAGLIDVRTHRPFDLRTRDRGLGDRHARDHRGQDGPELERSPQRSLAHGHRRFRCADQRFLTRRKTSTTRWFGGHAHNPERPARPASATGVRAVMGSSTTVGERKYPEVNASFQWRPPTRWNSITTTYTPNTSRAMRACSFSR